MNSKLIPVLASLSSLAVGAVAGYFAAKKKLEAKYEERYATELAQAKHHYRMAHKIGEYASPSDALAQRWPGATIPNDLDYDEETRGRQETDAVLAKFEETIDTEKYGGGTLPGRMHLRKNETRNRVVRVITHEEFLAAEVAYAQVSFTYFPDGEVLLDEDGEEMDDFESVGGKVNLENFSDDHLLYIRNDKLQIDIEVSRDLRPYAEVIGLQG